MKKLVRIAPFLLLSGVVVGLLIPSVMYAATESTSCSGFTNFWSSPVTCTWRALLGLIGSFFVSFGALVLYFAGSILDGVVYLGIVDFGNQYGKIRVGVEQVWTIIRDFANIGIIGAFVFVAISTILSIDQYSVKNFVAKLLIAAVLINFSLFFTKAAFDVSNMTAAVFANAIGATQVSSVTLSRANGGTVTGFAGAFLQALGVSASLDVTALHTIAEATDSGLMALFSGIFIFIFLILTAIVFMYASFLLLTRIVIVIFLMMVSAGAFAARAIPTMDSYWNQWKKQLLHSAFFAPLLMMFLWAVMVVAQRLTPTREENLSAIVQSISQNGQGTVTVTVLFNFAIIIGLLIAAIKSAGVVADYTAQYSLFKTGTNKGMSIMNKTPRAMSNLWDYGSSRWAYNRMQNEKNFPGSVQPNMFQKGWATARGLFGGDYDKIMGKMRNNKLARLDREQSGKVGLQYSKIPGLDKSVADLREGASTVKKIFEKGMDKGGYKSIAEKKEKETAAQDMQTISKAAQVSNAEQYDIHHEQLAQEIKRAFNQGAQGLSEDIVKSIETSMKKLEELKAVATDSDRSVSDRRSAEQRQSLERQEIARKIQNATNAITDEAKRRTVNENAAQRAKAEMGRRVSEKLETAISKLTTDPVKARALKQKYSTENDNKRIATLLKAAGEAAGVTQEKQGEKPETTTGAKK